MSQPEAYVREIDSLTDEIKRLSLHLKQMREQKKVAQRHLYEYMARQNLEKFQGHTLKSVQPRKPIPRKPKPAKKEDAIKLFRQAGIPDPEDFFKEFEATQKYTDSEEEQPKVVVTAPKKKKKQEYDPFLGF